MPPPALDKHHVNPWTGTPGLVKISPSKGFASWPGASVVAWASVTLLCALYYVIPLGILLFPLFASYYPRTAVLWCVACGVSMVAPTGPWPAARSFFQLWYAPFNVRANLGEIMSDKQTPGDGRYILCHFPHGVVPVSALVWCALCDQFRPGLYGFGAIAPILKYVPFFRQLYGWLGGGSPAYKVISKELKARNLYVLPDGIAGIFAASPGKHRVVFKDRRGLCKLAMEQGATLVPCYTFGMNEMFSTSNDDNAESSWLSKLCRRLSIGVVIFWGQFGLPIPRAAPLSFAFGTGVRARKLQPGEKHTKEEVDTLHALLCQNLVDVFEKYKAEAGFPDGKLEIV